MSFGEWQAYASEGTFSKDVRLNIVREIAPGEFEVITGLSAHGPGRVERLTPAEGEALPVDGMMLPAEAAEAVYHALHRLFGNTDPRGTEDALKVERARVEKVLDQLLAAVK